MSAFLIDETIVQIGSDEDSDIPAGTVDIALMNTSNETLAFDNDGYMASISGTCLY